MRRREEAVELRAILATRFEQRAQASNSSRPDSDQWSGIHSDDGSCSDLDEELSLGRQCRQLKSHIQWIIILSRRLLKTWWKSFIIYLLLQFHYVSFSSEYCSSYFLYFLVIVIISAVVFWIDRSKQLSRQLEFFRLEFIEN